MLILTNSHLLGFSLDLLPLTLETQILDALSEFPTFCYEH